MSTRDYACLEYGLVLNIEGMYDLLKKYNGDKLEKDFIERVINEDDYAEIDELTYNELSLFDSYGNFSGEFSNLKGTKTTDFYEETMYILYLDKFNTSNNTVLYTCYNNEEEVYDEIKKTLEKLGFNIDMEFIINNVGKINGIYWC